MDVLFQQATGIAVDLGAVATKVVEWLAIFALGGLVTGVVAYFRSQRKVAQDVKSLTTAVQEGTKAVNQLRQSVDHRMDEVEDRFDRQFADLQGSFKEWRGETQSIISGQETRVVRLEERLRAFMLTVVGRARLGEIETMLPDQEGKE